MQARRSVAALLLGLLALTPACSVFVGSLQPVTIHAFDPGAEIYVDGALVGTGSTTVELKRNHSHEVMARLGDVSASAQIERTISGTGVADLVGGFFLIVPFIGTLTPGFWELESDTIRLALPTRARTTPVEAPPESGANTAKVKESFEEWSARQKPQASGGGGG